MVRARVVNLFDTGMLDRDGSVAQAAR